MAERPVLHHPRAHDGPVTPAPKKTFAAFLTAKPGTKFLGAELLPLGRSASDIPAAAFHDLAIKCDTAPEMHEWTVVFTGVDPGRYDLKVRARDYQNHDADVTESDLQVDRPSLRFIRILYPNSPVPRGTVSAYGPIGEGHVATTVTLDGVNANQITNNTSMGIWTATFLNVNDAHDYTLVATDSGGHQDSRTVTVVMMTPELTRRLNYDREDVTAVDRR